MTKRELLDLLADLPDDAQVLVPSGNMPDSDLHPSTCRVYAMDAPTVPAFAVIEQAA